MHAQELKQFQSTITQNRGNVFLQCYAHKRQKENYQRVNGDATGTLKNRF